MSLVASDVSLNKICHCKNFADECAYCAHAKNSAVSHSIKVAVSQLLIPSTSSIKATATAAIAESKVEVVYYIVMNYEMIYTQAIP